MYFVKVIYLVSLANVPNIATFTPWFFNIQSEAIVVSESMTSALTLICDKPKEEPYFLILVGPSGIGKSTTLLWLIYQLQTHAIIVPGDFNLDPSEEKMYFYDFNWFSKLTDSDKMNLVKFVMNIWLKKSTFIMAFSGTVLCNKKDSTLLNSLLINSKYVKFEIKPLSATEGRALASKHVTNSDLLEYVVENACGFPSLLTINPKSKADFDAKVSIIVRQDWASFLDGISPVNLMDNIELLVAALYSTPITYLRRIEPATLLPFRCYLLYINEDNIPTLYINTKKAELEKVVQKLMDNLMATPGSDAQSAVGNCFEFQILPHFSSLTISIKEVYHKEDQPSDTIFLTTLRLSYVAERFVELPHKLDANCLYLLPKGTHGIDAISIIEKINFNDSSLENVLLLVQLTVEKDGHNAKLKSSVLLAGTRLFQKAASTQSDTPQIVLFLFIAARNQMDVSDGADIVQSIVDTRAFNATKKKERWYYAQPDEQTAVEITGTYQKLEVLLLPNARLL